MVSLTDEYPGFSSEILYSLRYVPFKNGGKPSGKIKVTGKAPKDRTGTTVTFTPDPTIFEDTDFRAQTVLERLQIMAFLNKGLEIRFEYPACIENISEIL